MKYRNFGKTEWNVSSVSLGVLQLEEAACAGKEDSDPRGRIEAIRSSIDAGVNYIDLGFPYLFTNQNKSCSYVREALSGGYREKVRVAVNIPARLVSAKEDMDRYLDGQLRLFGLEHADVCVIDWVYRETWPKLKALGLGQWLDDLISSGRALQAGYYFHDDAHYIVPIGEYWDGWSTARFDYSFMDEKHHPGSGGVGLAGKQGLGVVASDVFKGGRLLRDIPGSVQELWSSAPIKMTPAEWCLRWTLNDRNVSTALISPRSASEAGRLIRYAEACDADSLGINEIIHAKNVRDAYFALRAVPCPACRCCMPCPKGIDVPRKLELLNEALMYGDTNIPEYIYSLEGHGGTDCVGCGACQNACPRHYPLIELQKQACGLLSD